MDTSSAVCQGDGELSLSLRRLYRDAADCGCQTEGEVKLDTRKRLVQEDQVQFSDVTWILENHHKAQPIR